MGEGVIRGAGIKTQANFGKESKNRLEDGKGQTREELGFKERPPHRASAALSRGPAWGKGRFRFPGSPFVVLGMRHKAFIAQNTSNRQRPKGTLFLVLDFQHQVKIVRIAFFQKPLKVDLVQSQGMVSRPTLRKG